MSEIKLRNIKTSYHRNGVGGVGFHLVAFEVKNGRKWDALAAVVFDTPGECAVFDPGRVVSGLIDDKFAGDLFEKEIRLAIAEWESGR